MRASRTKILTAPLWRDLDRDRTARRLTWAEVAAEIGVAESTLFRIKAGQPPQAATLLDIALWLGSFDLSPYVERI